MTTAAATEPAGPQGSAGPVAAAVDRRNAMSTQHALHLLAEGDDVAVALRDLTAGEEVPSPDGTLTLVQGVPRGHKVAVRQVAAGRPVVKYGHVIGYATAPIARGEHVHSHNLEFGAHEAPGRHEAPVAAAVQLPARRTYLGIGRSDGSVATRNYVAVVSSVNCSATVCRAIATRAEASGLLARYPSIDGVVPVTHSLGCGMAAEGNGMDVLRRTLMGYATHPNVGGVLLVSLGCEVNQMEHMLEGIEFRPGTPVVRLTIQEDGGSRRTIERGLAEIEAMAPVVADVRRTEFDVSTLVLGLNCGGSDGWSGVTANPALGVASDLVVAQGGRSVLAETPEIYGAEDLLVARAASPEVGRKVLDTIAWWEGYTTADGGSMDNNPSPGNKEGGITTILEKSLGAVAKAGHAPLADVYAYAEPITTPGLGFMDTPGYDPVSVTGLIAGGATLVAFTTGRGSALGTRPAPTLKLATNSAIYAAMGDDMDLNCGDVVDEGVSLEAKGLQIYEALLDVASGRRTSSEELGYGDDEFVPWHIGAVM